MFAGGFCAVEAEFVYRVGQDAPVGKPTGPRRTALALVDALFIGVEIAGCRRSPQSMISGRPWSRRISATMRGLVLGAAIAGWRPGAGDRLLTVETSIDGASVGEGNAASFPADRPQALAFVFGAPRRRGRPMRAGQFISTGAITGVHDDRASASGASRRSRDSAIFPAACCDSVTSSEAKTVSRRIKGRGTNEHGDSDGEPASAGARAAIVRWIVVGLLFTAMVINYVDRQMLGFLKPTLCAGVRLERDATTPTSSSSFRRAYAVAYLCVRPHRRSRRREVGFTPSPSSIWTIGHVACGAARKVTAVHHGAHGARRGRRRAAFRAASRPWPNGFRRKSARSPPASSTPAPISAPSSRPWSCLVWSTIASAGKWRSWSRAWSSLVWLPVWLIMYRNPRSTSA